MKFIFNSTVPALECGFRPRCSDPVVLHHPTRKSVGYFGAVRLRDGRFFFRAETGNVRCHDMLGFLAEAACVQPPGRRRVMVIIDNARYHHARFHRDGREQEVERFRLDYLPPYSPELNPAERIWKLTRRLCIHNRYFRNLAEVARLPLKPSLRSWTKPNDTLRRLRAIT